MAFKFHYFLIFYFEDRLEVDTLNQNRQLVLHLRQWVTLRSRLSPRGPGRRSGWATLAPGVAETTPTDSTGTELGHLPGSQRNQAQGRRLKVMGAGKGRVCVFSQVALLGLKGPKEPQSYLITLLCTSEGREP